MICDSWLVGATLSQLAACSSVIKQKDVAVCLLSEDFENDCFQSEIFMSTSLFITCRLQVVIGKTLLTLQGPDACDNAIGKARPPARFGASHCTPRFELSLRMLCPCTQKSVSIQDLILSFCLSHLPSTIYQARVGRRALITGMLKPNPREGQGMPVDLIVHEIDYLADPVSKPSTR